MINNLALKFTKSIDKDKKNRIIAALENTQ